ncbi:MAG: hypothetical protein ACYDB7_03750 [Mycobacteriales bacterium]
MRISAAQRIQNENRIRSAMDRLLRGEIPPGAGCDIKTLAREAGADRTAFYGKRPYAHLRAEFEQRLQNLKDSGARPDPRDAHVDRLKNEITALKKRLVSCAATIEELTSFRAEALARLAAQHDEITRLRSSAGPGRVASLPRRAEESR